MTAEAIMAPATGVNEPLVTVPNIFLFVKFFKIIFIRFSYSRPLFQTLSSSNFNTNQYFDLGQMRVYASLKFENTNENSTFFIKGKNVYIFGTFAKKFRMKSVFIKF